jgi:serine/threonine protein kinase
MMSIAPDTVLVDRYQIREQLSQKAGRLTFLADDLQLQKLVIVKILKFDSDFQWDDLKLFEREALTLKNLDHPAIPKYLDYFDLEAVDIRGFALVQTYINAPSLESIIKSGQKFSEPEVIELADRLLSILTYLHDRLPPVIHRDIKPSNILLANHSGNRIGDVYLVDFGSVQTVTSKEDGTITIVGTYGYIPLEQFGGQTTIASDLYSLGMTLIYLITGIHPAAMTYVNGQVKITAEISYHFRRWLERITQPYVDKRFDSDRSAQTALKSSNGSYGYFTHLQPVNSRIKLYRDRDKLEILLPKHVLEVKLTKAGGLKKKDILEDMLGYGCLLWILLFSVLLLIHALVAYTFLGYSLVALICISIVSVTFDNISKYASNRWIRWCYRSIICHEFICTRDRIIYSKKPGKIASTDRRSQFDLVIYNPGYTFDKYLDNNGNILNRGRVTTQAELQIYCQSNKYLFSNGLSQPELYWIGQEISDFLDLELQIIYPTPQVPPDKSSSNIGGCGAC